MDSAIEGLVNDNITMDSAIEGLVNDNITMDSAIEGLVNVRSFLLIAKNVVLVFSRS
jgi:hypothetical protein